MVAQVQFEQHEKLLWHFARRVHRRMFGAGAQSVQLDDVFQELTIAWCVARDKWTPEHGVPFIAYLRNGLRNQINRWAQEKITAAVNHLDLDAPFGEESDSSLHDIVAAPSEDVAQSIDDKARRDRVLNRVSPRTKQFLELLDSPPPELFAIVNALRERRQFAVSRGVSSAGIAPRVTAGIVFDVMDCSGYERRLIMGELKRVVKNKPIKKRKSDQ